MQDIIPRMRSDTLKDVHILFSSVIPLDTKPESTEIWRVAHMFGAKCYTELSSLITHVVAAKVKRSNIVPYVSKLIYMHTARDRQSGCCAKTRGD